MPGYSTTVPRRPRPRVHHAGARELGKPFLLYETPQAPHWVEVTNPDGTTSSCAVPDPKYANAPVGTCSGVAGGRPQRQAGVRADHELHDRPGAGDVPEPAAGDHDRRRRVRRDHAAAVRPRRARQHPGDLLLRQRLHVGRARAHGEVRPVRAVASACRCGSAGRVTSRPASTRPGLVSYLDLLPTMLAGGRRHRCRPDAPPLDGESLLRPSSRGPRCTPSTTQDPANGERSRTWRMVRTATASTSRPTTPAARVIVPRVLQPRRRSRREHQPARRRQQRPTTHRPRSSRHWRAGSSR